MTGPGDAPGRGRVSDREEVGGPDAPADALNRPARVLVAGFGNELRGDDGFGIRVLEVLGSRLDGREDVELFHVGTGGLRLAQELLAGYDALVVIDAMNRDQPPGTLYVMEVEDVTHAEMVDLHLATPSRALSVAKALGSLPERVWMVGCEPAAVDHLDQSLTPEVAAQVGPAVDAVLRLLGPSTPDGERA